MALSEFARTLIQQAVDKAIEDGATPGEVRAEVEYAIEVGTDG